ncbi:MAG: hypothetical protein NWQ38_15755 [Cellulophaga sp.]|nr:hypothetical protein [Cellulophaga sp.]
MGLAERRIAKDFQENEYQAFLKEIQEIVGKEITVEVSWDTLSVDGMSHLYKECWPQVYFQPLTQALKSICEDEMGKEAIADELQKIIIKNEEGISSESRWASFSDKILVLDHKPTTNINQIDARANKLQKLLEDSL